jgi:hypothetical protein
MMQGEAVLRIEFCIDECCSGGEGFSLVDRECKCGFGQIIFITCKIFQCPESQQVI